MPEEAKRPARRFDATLKHLVESRPAEWLAYLGLPLGTSVGAVDADLSSVTAAADKVLRVDGPEAYIAHLEFQSGVDPELDRRMLLYNVLLRSRHGLPVRTAVFLLHPRTATATVLGGVRDVSDPHCRLEFSYRLLRVWEQPPESFLHGGLAMLALACVAARSEELEKIYNLIAAKLRAEASEADAREIWAATFIMSGLRHDLLLVERLMKGEWNMGWEENSVTYQAILAQGEAKGQIAGRIREAKALLLRLGTRRFESPPMAISDQIQRIDDLPRLEALIERTIDASSWEELLSTNH